MLRRRPHACTSAEVRRKVLVCIAACVAAVLKATCVSAIQHTQLFNSTAIQDPDIKILTSLPGVARALTEAELEPLLRDNLEPDLLPWRELGRPLTEKDFLDFLNQIDTKWAEYRRNFIAIVVIRNNTMTWWNYPDARGWCIRRVKYISEQFHHFAATAGIRFPDVVYVMNGYDKPLCDVRNCSAPIFSFDKKWNHTSGRGLHDDILHPVMNHPFEHLITYPWEKKKEVGLMRAGIYAAMGANCSRVQMYKLARTKAGREVFDVGIYQNRHWRVKVKLSAPVPMEDHAKWKYLVNTDGQSASWRFAKLMAINSAILNFRSDNIEYYYRSVKEGQHYVSIDSGDAVEVIKGLPRRDREMQAMALRAQAFAFRYLSQHSRTLYAKVSFDRYKALFSDMDEFVQRIPEDFSMQWFLSLRSRMLL